MRLDLEVKRDVGNGTVVVLCRGAYVWGRANELVSRGKKYDCAKKKHEVGKYSLPFLQLI